MSYTITIPDVSGRIDSLAESAGYRITWEDAVAKKSPMSLSLDYLAKCGFTCHIVEKRLPIPGKFVTQDCFGFGDILCYGQAPEQNDGRVGIALVQTTSWDNYSTRYRKIMANPHFKPWKRAGGRIFLHGWGDRGLREEEL